MKKLAVLMLALLLAALPLLACGDADDPNAVFVDPNAVHGGEYGDLYFEADGVRFGIYDEAEPVLAALPAYRATFTGETCAFDSEDVYYYYSGYQIMANAIDGVLRITAITVADDTVKTPQGLYIGMSETDAAAAFPKLLENDWNLIDGSALLSVTMKDGVIASIVYTPSSMEN